MPSSTAPIPSPETTTFRNPVFNRIISALDLIRSETINDARTQVHTICQDALREPNRTQRRTYMALYAMLRVAVMALEFKTGVASEQDLHHHCCQAYRAADLVEDEELTVVLKRIAIDHCRNALIQMDKWPQGQSSTTIAAKVDELAGLVENLQMDESKVSVAGSKSQSDASPDAELAELMSGYGI